MSNFFKEYCKSDIRKDLIYLNAYSLLNLDDVAKKFDIEEISGLLAIFYYAYRKGYLSYKHTFKFDKDRSYSADLPPNDLGFYIVEGYGVCRNISYQLKAFLTLNNIKSYVATTDSKEFSNSPRTLALYVNLFPSLLGNHVVNYIKYDNISFLYDPTNNYFPKIMGYSLLQYPNDDKIQPVWIVNSINNGIIMPVIKKAPPSDKMMEIVDSYLNYLELFDNNIDIFERLYADNKEIYFEFHDKFSKVKEKKLY